MQDVSLGVVESRFADIIWGNAPMPSSELVKQAEEVLGWKKSTTYTVLKRLCEKGIFENSGGTVTVKISREDFYAIQSNRYVETSFGGSLPSFLAAFTSGKKLTKQELHQLRCLLDRIEEG